MPGRGQAAGEFDRTGDLRLRRVACTRHFGDQTARHDLRVLDRFTEVEHRLDAGIQAGEYLTPLGEIAFLELDFDLAFKRLLILRFLRQPARSQLRAADGGAEL